MKIEGNKKTGVVKLDGKVLRIEKSLRCRDHSPTGFAWGYLGSGPSQLALAILIDKIGEQEALKYYHQFKFDHVANWGISDFDVEIDFDKWLTTAKMRGFR